MTVARYVWPDHHSIALEGCIAAGMSYSQAAVEINEQFSERYTRNACIGRGRRMGLKSSALSGPHVYLAPAERRRRKNERERIRRMDNLADKERRDRDRKEARGIMLSRGAKTTSAEYRKHLPPLPEMTKSELRAMLAQAIQNTIDMGVS